MNLFIQPVLAIDIPTLFSVIFLVIAFLGWLMNLVSSKEQPPPPRRGPGPQQPRPMRAPQGQGQRPQPGNPLGPRPNAPPQRRTQQDILEEIDVFLEEVKSQRGGSAQGQLPRPVQAQQPSRPSNAPPVETPPTKPEELGAGVRTHLEQYMQPRMDQQVEEHMWHTSQLGLSAAPAASTGNLPARQASPGAAPALLSEGRRTGTSLAKRIVPLLKNPTTVRQAMVITEILNRPRHRRGS